MSTAVVPAQVALVSQSGRVSLERLQHYATALQEQVVRDFGPIWRVSATVSAYADARQVPSGHWPIFIQDDIHMQGAAGVHLDDHNQPYAVVESYGDVSLTLSHELLEMLADPWGNRVIAGHGPRNTDFSRRRVHYLLEVCDPCEGKAFAYLIGDVLVSDFLLPSYWSTVSRLGQHHSFTGAIDRVLTVLPDGYVSWTYEGEWFQLTNFRGKAEIRDLGVADKVRAGASIRNVIDQASQDARRLFVGAE